MSRTLLTKYKDFSVTVLLIYNEQPKISDKLGFWAPGQLKVYPKCHSKHEILRFIMHVNKTTKFRSLITSLLKYFCLVDNYLL